MEIAGPEFTPMSAEQTKAFNTAKAIFAVSQTLLSVIPEETTPNEDRAAMATFVGNLAIAGINAFNNPGRDIYVIVPRCALVEEKVEGLVLPQGNVFTHPLGEDGDQGMISYAETNVTGLCRGVLNESDGYLSIFVCSESVVEKHRSKTQVTQIIEDPTARVEYEI